jgi:hypothetical protein
VQLPPESLRVPPRLYTERMSVEAVLARDDAVHDRVVLLDAGRHLEGRPHVGGLLLRERAAIRDSDI